MDEMLKNLRLFLTGMNVEHNSINDEDFKTLAYILSKSGDTDKEETKNDLKNASLCYFTTTEPGGKLGNMIGDAFEQNVFGKLMSSIKLIPGAGPAIISYNTLAMASFGSIPNTEELIKTTMGIETNMNWTIILINLLIDNVSILTTGITGIITELGNVVWEAAKGAIMGDGKKKKKKCKKGKKRKKM